MAIKRAGPGQSPFPVSSEDRADFAEAVGPPTKEGTWTAKAEGTVNYKPDGYDTRFHAAVVTLDGLPVRTGSGGTMVTTDEGKLQAIRDARAAYAASPIPYLDTWTIQNDFRFSPETALAMVEASSAFYEDSDFGAKLAKQWGFNEIFPVSKKAEILHDLPVPRFIKQILNRDVQGALAMSPDAIVMGFRGTERGNLGDLATDIAVLNPNDTEYGKLHRGFNEAKNLIIGDLIGKLESEWRKDIADGKKPRPVYLTGHSMGGALATLAGPDVSKLIQKMKSEFPGASFDIGGIYTFGSPRPGNSSFADAYKQIPASTSGASLADRTFGIAIQGDPVVSVPSLFHSWTHVAMNNLHAYRARVGEATDRPDTIAVEAIMVGDYQKLVGDESAPSPLAHHLLANYRRLVRELVRHPELVRPNPK